MALKCARVGLAAAPVGLQFGPKVALPWYLTPEHRAWAKSVVERDGHRCKCGRTRGRMFANHIVELRDGGAPLDLANGETLCGSCHSRVTAAARASRLARGR